MDVRLNGSFDDDAPTGPHLMARPPPLEPLPDEPSDRDFAKRYATIAEWHYEQHPHIVAELRLLRKDIAFLSRMRVQRQWPQYATFVVALVILAVVFAQSPSVTAPVTTPADVLVDPPRQPQ